MAVGKVKWFNNAKGFGFIVPEEGGEDIFAHYSTIQMEGYRSLKAGQEVTFEVQQGPKGLHAENIGLVGRRALSHLVSRHRIVSKPYPGTSKACLFKLPPVFLLNYTPKFGNTNDLKLGCSRTHNPGFAFNCSAASAWSLLIVV